MARPLKATPEKPAELYLYPPSEPDRVEVLEPADLPQPAEMEPPPRPRREVDVSKFTSKTTPVVAGNPVPLEFTVALARPKNNQIWKAHPDPIWNQGFHLFMGGTLKEGGNDTMKGTTFLVQEDIALALIELRDGGATKLRRLCYWMDSEGAVGLWDVGIVQGVRNESLWITTANKAISHALKGWVSVSPVGVSHKGQYQTYSYPTQEDRGWPDLTISEVLASAFGELGQGIIDTLDHPAIANLLKGVKL